MAMKKNGRISYRYRAKPLKGFSENGAKTYNKAIKFVPAYGLHRTPLSGRRLLLALVAEESYESGNPFQNVDV